MGLARWYNRGLNRLWGFIEDRTSMRRWALRPQPEFSFKPSYWTGGFLATAFLYQVVSGAFLLLYYQPSAATNATYTACGQAAGTLSPAPAAWCSTYYIVHSVPLGSLLLTTHLYGAYAMIFLLFVHLFRGYYLGAYKPPREFSWMIGVLLLALTMAMGFTGYLLPYTQLSYNATNVGLAIALRVPTLGPFLGPFLLGDGTPQGLLSRMFGAHIVLLPLAIAVLLYAHVALFESHGIAPPATSDPLQRRRFTDRESKSQVPFMPHILLYMAKWALLYIGVLFGIAALWPWNLPTYVGNLGVSPGVTEPDWYFLWLYKLVDIQGVTPLIAFGIPTGILLFLLVVPFLDRSKRTHPRDRPVFVWIGTSLLTFFIVMTVWGGETPGVEVSPWLVAETLGPIFVVNAVAVVSFHRRYVRSYRERLAAQAVRVGRVPGPVSPSRASSISPVGGTRR